MKLKNKILLIIFIVLIVLAVILPISTSGGTLGTCEVTYDDYSSGDRRRRTVNYENMTEVDCMKYIGQSCGPRCYMQAFWSEYEDPEPEPDPEPTPEPDPEPDPEPTPTPEPEPEPIPDPTKADFCNAIKNKYNTSATNCAAAAIAANTTNFAGRSPHVTLSNGLVLYISDYGTISALSDATDTADRKGFILFVDVNGSKGNSVLYEDVFPYYLTSGGKVIPGYKDEDDNRSGAANKDNLSMNVIYDSYANDKREVKLLMKDSNFKRAACATGYVKSSKYCDGDVQYNLCKKDYHDCRFIINKPFKLF